MLALFHASGKIPVLRLRLKIVVMIEVAESGRSLIIWFEMLSGPHALCVGSCLIIVLIWL